MITRISIKLNKSQPKLLQDMAIIQIVHCFQISGIALQGLTFKMWTLSISRLWTFLIKQKSFTWTDNRSYLPGHQTFHIRIHNYMQGIKSLKLHSMGKLICWIMTHLYIKFNLLLSLSSPLFCNPTLIKETIMRSPNWLRYLKMKNQRSSLLLLHRTWNRIASLLYSKRCRVKSKSFLLKLVELGKARWTKRKMKSPRSSLYLCVLLRRGGNKRTRK